ncbi:MAG: tetratricopeptide repeat protein [Nannocystales bacterium]
MVHLLLALTLALVPDPAQLKRVALELFDEERYEEARAVLDALYRTHPDPEVLYARAVVYKRLGDCAVAVELFELFMGGETTDAAAAIAQAHVEECAAELEPTEPSPPRERVEPPPPVVPEPTVALPQPRAEPQRRWFQDPWGGVLSGTGLVTAGVGVGLLVGARSIARRVDLEPTEGAFSREVDRGRSYERVGFTLTGVGAALLVGGVLRYVVVSRRHR